MLYNTCCMKSKKIKGADWIVGVCHAFVVRQIAGLFMLGFFIIAIKFMSQPFVVIEKLVYVAYPILVWPAVMLSARFMPHIFEIQHVHKVTVWSSLFIVLFTLGSLKDTLIPGHYSILWAYPAGFVVFYFASRKYFKGSI